LLANEAARASDCLENLGLKKEAGPHTCLAFDQAFSTPAERLSLRVRGNLPQRALIRIDDSSRTVSPSSRWPYVLKSNQSHSESSISAKFSTEAPTPRPTLSEQSDRHRDLFLTSRRHACTTSLDASHAREASWPCVEGQLSLQPLPLDVLDSVSGLSGDDQLSGIFLKELVSPC
jgi:hypothetical protein